MTEEDATTPPPVVPSILTRLSGLSGFALISSAAALFFLGIGFMTISELDAIYPYFISALSSGILFLAFGLVSSLGFVFIFTTRPSMPIEPRVKLTGPLQFLLFGWLCLFFTAANVSSAMDRIEELPGVQTLLATDGTSTVVLQVAAAIIILGFSLYLIRREWKKSARERQYFQLVLCVWLVNIVGSFLSILVTGSVGLPELGQDVDSAMELSWLLSHAVACVTWPSLLLLTTKGMRESVGRQLGGLVSTEEMQASGSVTAD